MKILLPSTDVQELKIRARKKEVLVRVLLRNEMTNDEVTIIPSASLLNDDWLSVSISYDFVEGENYEMRIEDLNEDLMWRGKLFITAQADLENYTVNYE